MFREATPGEAGQPPRWLDRAGDAPASVQGLDAIACRPKAARKWQRLLSGVQGAASPLQETKFDASGAQE